eukprot:GHVU01156467.1.p1 GENE.GHVU01156467.1~~GHVU01156467.1.p1  ORF type:complete len:225 (-),score=21.90 GHVU01156467.1:93-767(-)
MQMDDIESFTLKTVTFSDNSFLSFMRELSAVTFKVKFNFSNSETFEMSARMACSFIPSLSNSDLSKLEKASAFEGGAGVSDLPETFFIVQEGISFDVIAQCPDTGVSQELIYGIPIVTWVEEDDAASGQATRLWQCMRAEKRAPILRASYDPISCKNMKDVRFHFVLTCSSDRLMFCIQGLVSAEMYTPFPCLAARPETTNVSLDRTETLEVPLITRFNPLCMK